MPHSFTSKHNAFYDCATVVLMTVNFVACLFFFGVVVVVVVCTSALNVFECCIHVCVCMCLGPKKMYYILALNEGLPL